MKCGSSLEESLPQQPALLHSLQERFRFLSADVAMEDFLALPLLYVVIDPTLNPSALDAALWQLVEPPNQVPLKPLIVGETVFEDALEDFHRHTVTLQYSLFMNL